MAAAERACVRRCECLRVKAKQIVAVAEAVQQQPCGPIARAWQVKHLSVCASFFCGFIPSLLLLHPSLLVSI